MKINLDDPKLTAYALDELSGAEKSEMEKAVAESPEAQAYVDELRELCLDLTSEYEAERRSRVAPRANIIPIAELDRPWTPSRRFAFAAAIAVCALIGAVVVARVKLGGTSDLRSSAHRASAAKQDNAQVVEAEPEEAVVTDSTLAEADKRAQLPASTPAISPLQAESRTAGSIVREARRSRDAFGTIPYEHAGEHPFLKVARYPLSTFPVDVGTGSYETVRGFIESGSLPPKDAIRVDEMLNYFSYDYPQPTGGYPFSITLEAMECPWAPWGFGHRLVRIGLKGEEVATNGQAPNSSTTIAKDVTIEVAFNPARVAAYRLIGYEKSSSIKGNLSDAQIDADEVGPGHTVTALYEVVPVGTSRRLMSNSPELATVRLRYKTPVGDQRQLIERTLPDNRTTLATTSPDLEFAAAVAEFGLLLRDSPYKGRAAIRSVLRCAERGKGANGDRAGFIELVRKAQSLIKG
jgi:uncharacterized protein DUF3520/protein with von Willebrand factor-like domain